MPELWKILLTLCLSTVILIYTKAIAIPLVISVFAYTVITEASGWLHLRLKIPRVWATVLTLLLATLVLALVMAFVGHSFSRFAAGASAYQMRLASTVSELGAILESFGVETDLDSLRNELEALPIFSTLRSMTGGALKFVGNAALVLVFLGFLFAGRPQVVEKNSVVGGIRRKVSTYVITKTAVSLLTGTLVFAVLLTFGVELAFSLALLTVFLNFIPNIGSIVATILPVPILWLQFGFGWQFFAVLLISAAIQFAVGNVAEPRLIGQSLDIHPIAVLTFLLFWGLIWGLPGMFLAVPMTVALKIIMEEFDSTFPIAEAIAGRGAFGQRQRRVRKK